MNVKKLLSALLIFLFANHIIAAPVFPAGFSQVKIASISEATAMAFAPDGRIFVGQRDGTIKIIKNGALLGTPFLKLTTDQNGERGVSGITFDPNFNSNHYIYIYYTATTPTIHNRLSRFTANGDLVVAGSEYTLLDAEPLQAIYHNGGGLLFGKDGKLYLSMGEDNKPSNSQSMTTYKGKLLRMNPDGSAPTDNPYYSSSNPITRLIWCMGLRNPYTMAKHPVTGRLFVNNVGADDYEEVHDGTASGKNFGWPYVEGYGSDPAYTNPIFAYPHDATGQHGCAVTGGAFFNPTTTNYPSQYAGKYFYQEFCNGWIWYFTPGTTSASNNTVFATGLTTQNLALQVGPDGNLYYLNRKDSYAGVYKIIYNNNNPPAITQQPASVSVPAGQSASFSVSATGALPLTYQWKKNGTNISGATSSTYTIPSTAASHAGQYTVQVSNSYGSVTSNAATLTVTSANNRPVAAIFSPATPAYFRAGDVINFAGNATDQEDGTLPASVFQWSVEFHHNNNHFHPGQSIPSGVKTGSFTTSTTDHSSANVFYRLKLIVSDSQGQKDTAWVDIHPITSTITVNSQPAGLQITFDSQPFPAPHSSLTVEGLNVPIGAMSPQNYNGKTYVFHHWTVGGNANPRTVKVGAGDSTYTAVFVESTSPTCTAAGTISRELWNNVTGTRIVSIPLTTPPSSSSQISIFETPQNFADNYGQRIRGYICPPVSGSYIFWIASDDHSELWLSTNDNPANKVMISSVSGYTASREWNKYPSQKSAAINLIAGVRYYIEALHKEGSQGDNLAVGWQLPNGTQERPIPGTRLSPFINTGNTPVVSITSPADGSSFPAPSTINITATASSAGGTISKVEFYNGTTKLGEDLTSPYSFAWNNVTTGNYVLKAVAVNNTGQTGTSASVNISVGGTGASCTASGTISRELWSNVTGTRIVSIPLSTPPSSSSQIAIFETPQSFADNYGQRIRGYICPPVSGNYIFWIASDDHSELWLSTNDSPANKVMICSVYGYTASREWTKYPSQKSAAINLTAGVRYYIEALHKEGTQGDNFAVGWQLPNGTQERPIPGTRLSPFTTTSTGTTPVVSITYPSNGQTFSNPSNINITATASSTGGSISKVEFYNGTTKLGEDLTSPYSYLWNNVTTGNYVLKAIATNNTGQTKTSANVNITVAACTTPIVKASGPLTMCSGSVTLSTTYISGNMYQWKKDGVDIHGATSYQYTANTTGDYQVKVIQGSCISWSAPVRVQIQSGLQATITPGGPTTFCQGGNVKLYANTCSGYTYQWKKNGAYIAGATASTYTATTSGSYQLQTTLNGASAWSALVNVTVNTCRESEEEEQLEEITNEETATEPLVIEDAPVNFQMKVYPNPTSGLFTLQLNMPSNANEKVTMRVVNMLGQEVFKKDFEGRSDYLQETVELDNTLETGIYTLQVIMGSKSENTSIVLSR